MKSIKRKSVFTIFAFVMVGIFGVLSADRLAQNIKIMKDNPLIIKLKAQLAKYSEERAGERLYLHFDKPFYKPNETIWFQAYLRNEADMKPAQKSEIVHVEFINPKGNVEKHLRLMTKNGVASGDIELAEGIAGGLYKIKAYTNWQKNQEDPFYYERDIQVQNVILPRLKMKPDFEKKAYGAGDKVTATLELQTLENQPLKNYEFTYVASLNGKQILQNKSKTDKNGKANVTFELPKKITTTDGLLNFMINYEGRTESVSRSIPILLNNIKLAIFPEGGDLVEGLETKVAFQAKNEFDKPADFQAVLLDNKGSEVLKFNSFHQGMGAFSFTPQKDKSYEIKITNPKGIAQTFALPETQKRGYILNAEPQKNDKILLQIRTTESEELSIIGQIRGQVFYSNSFNSVRGNSTISVDVSDAPMGVAQFTLFDKKGIERAERLVFVNKKNQLSIEIETDKEKYLPREKVQLTIHVRDERGMPIPANLSLSVTDDKLISFADDKQGQILSKLLLEPDLKGKIEAPNFYFDDEEPKANQALDYLLMTQGWRKFVWEKVRKEAPFQAQFPAEKTLVGGYVYANGNPLKRGKVQILDKKLSTLTDSNGYFEFHNLDLSEIITLSVNENNFSDGQIRVNEYRQNYDLHLYPIYRKHRGLMDRVQRAIGLAENEKMMDAEPDEGAGFELEMAEEMLVEMPENQQKNMINNVQKPDLVVQPTNIKKDADLDLVAVADIPAAEVAVLDNRFEAIKANKKIAGDVLGDDNELAENLEVLYHRKKIFPKIVYNQDKTPEIRTDFRATIFWKGDIQTDNKGKAILEFYNSDEVTSFRVTAEGIGVDGLVGHSEKTYFTQLPFSMSVKVPVAVTMGDELKIPLTLKNNTKRTLSGNLEIISPQAWKANFSGSQSQTIEAGETKTIYLDYTVLNQPSKGNFTAKFKSSWAKDAFNQEVITEAKGFPVALAMSGNEAEKEYKFMITNPIEGTLTADFVAYPTSLSDMMAGIESMIREPYGCFEQTSSSTYPNIMALQYMEEYDYDNQEVIARAKNMVDKGYKRLVSFETSEKGYEWFGGAPAHEALTAYGLMEFRDMTSVYHKVDNQMVNRTAEWLLSRKDHEGGFERNPRALDSFGGASKEITDAYIVYALTEAGFDSEKLRKEVEKTYETASKSKDSYQMALLANALLNLKDKRAEKLLADLIKMQKQDGSWEGATHSITRSTGQGLQIETTSLAVLAMLKSSNKSVKNMDSGVKFILTNRSSYGGFGNTQSTVLALKALTEYAKFAKRTAESGDIEIYLDGKKIAEKHYEAGTQEAISVEISAKLLTEGEHHLKVKYKGVKNPLPYTVSVKYTTYLPQSSAECAVNLTTKLAENRLKTGETVRLNTTLTNTKNEGLPMTMAVVGLPAGLSPQPWQLKELQEKQVFDYYEVIGNSIAFYYRQMKPSEVREINLDLKAEIPGEYEAVASSAYLYYTNEHKKWVQAEKVVIR